EARNLADRDVLAAVAILDRGDLGLESGRLGEGALHRAPVVADAVDGDDEIEPAIRVIPNYEGHLPSFLCPMIESKPPPQAASSSVFCWMRKMTNSAGLTGAMPTSQISMPASISASVIVVRSQRTKNASSCVSPRSAPLCQTWRRKLPTLWRTRAQVGS